MKTAIYVRVSTNQQSVASQLPDLQRWATANSDQEIVWFKEKGTGTTMNRPVWKKIEDMIRTKEVSTLVVWRLDRLGRTASGLLQLFEMLNMHKCNLISIKESIDLKSPAGRLLAGMLASMAAYETEVRGERVKAGQIAARAAGKRWGGRKKGVRSKVTPEMAKQILLLKKSGQSTASVARAMGLSLPTVWSVIKNKK